MAALPTTTVAFASGATEAQFKTFLSEQRNYLAGLFGTDGTAATAKATLGIVAGVSSVNGNTGAVTAAQVAAAATAGYGYTPANGANYSLTSHTHSGFAPIRQWANVIGGIVGTGSRGESNSPSPGGTYTGSGTSVGLWSVEITVSGTWICIATFSPPTSGTSYGGLFQRIS